FWGGCAHIVLKSEKNDGEGRPALPTSGSSRSGGVAATQQAAADDRTDDRQKAGSTEHRSTGTAGERQEGARPLGVLDGLLDGGQAAGVHGDLGPGCFAGGRHVAGRGLSLLDPVGLSD